MNWHVLQWPIILHWCDLDHSLMGPSDDSRFINSGMSFSTDTARDNIMEQITTKKPTWKKKKWVGFVSEDTGHLNPFSRFFFFFIWKKKMDQLLLVNGVGTHKKPMAQYFSLLEHHNWRELLDLWSTYNYRANSNQDRFKPSIIILNEKGIPSSIKERRFSLGIIPRDIFTLFFEPLAGKRSPHKWRRVTYLEIDP